MIMSEDETDHFLFRVALLIFLILITGTFNWQNFLAVIRDFVIRSCSWFLVKVQFFNAFLYEILHI